MSRLAQIFGLPQSLKIEALRTHIHKPFHLQNAETHLQIRRYYDSFDWRMYAADTLFFAETYPEAYTLYWADLNDGALLYTAQTDHPPRFAQDLPPSPLQKKLAGHLEPRALLPLIEVQRQVHVFRVCNKDKKTLARIILAEPGTARDLASGAEKPTDGYLQVVSVKGYEKPSRKLIKALKRDLNLHPAKPELLPHLAAFGHTPGSYEAKTRLTLDPNERADVAIYQILLTLLRTMQKNEPGMRADLDSEFVHDFRVAVRRTRSILGRLKRVFPPNVLAHFRVEFKWLGAITGPTRDMDVYLLRMPDYQSHLPARIRDDLAPLGRYLEVHQRDAHEEMIAHLDTDRYKALQRDWENFLTGPLPKKPMPDAVRPILAVVKERTWRLYQRVRKDGLAIGPNTPAEAYHTLRIDCKKLRYMMDLFRSLYPKQEIKKCIVALKDLQEVLGDFQDFEVQQIRIQQFAEDMLAESARARQTVDDLIVEVTGFERNANLSQGQGLVNRPAKNGTHSSAAPAFNHPLGEHTRPEGHVPAETITAMGRLEAYLELRQHQAKNAFAASFARFNAKHNQRRFRKLFLPTDQQT